MNAPLRQPLPPADLDAPQARALARRYAEVRDQTTALIAPLSEADCQVQPMPDASPMKWHLAHVTWFFETFVLERHERGFRPHHPAFRVLFNSYYNGIGSQHPRVARGQITRPTLAEVLGYRAAVDRRMGELLAGPVSAALADLVTLGLNHEQQHQELMLTDLLYLLSCNPLAPVYRPGPAVGHASSAMTAGSAWVGFEGGLVETGHRPADGFHFDNEAPRHRSWLEPYALAARPVSQGDWADFTADGGYREPRWWLSAGWDWVRQQAVQAPLYWREDGPGRWQQFTLQGLIGLDREAPVAHISYFEADAYARWRSAQDTGRRDGRGPLRLPTEAEWEHAAAHHEAAGIAHGNLFDRGAFRPLPADGPADADHPLQHLFGDVWEWTASSYAAYPGFQSWSGEVGEYNAKFMVNQYVLRGGSCATPRSHIRASYRNFFPTDARWQFNGVRLAADLP